MSAVLNVLLTHQPPEQVRALAAQWEAVAGSDRILIVYGGSPAHFEALAFSNKVFVADPRLRTKDHQRELQSYTGVYRAAAEWMKGRDFSHIYFSEFDHLPLVADLNARLLNFLAQEKADVAGHELLRVDGTNQPHYLHHLANPLFHQHWRQMSIRFDKDAVLSMLGTGSFWTREAFDAVAAQEEPFPIYLELFLPTAAHHLGFRVRDFGAQSRFVRSLGEMSTRIPEAQLAGAWTIHPVKNLPPRLVLV